MCLMFMKKKIVVTLLFVLYKLLFYVSRGFYVKMLKYFENNKCRITNLFNFNPLIFDLNVQINNNFIPVLLLLQVIEAANIDIPQYKDHLNVMPSKRSFGFKQSEPSCKIKGYIFHSLPVCFL